MPVTILKKSFRNVVLLPRFSKVLLFLVLTFLLFIFSLSIFGENVTELRAVSQQSISPKAKSKILCYVLISPRKLIAARTIKKTWGSKCDKLIFYGRFTNQELPVTYIEASEGYRYLWGKTQAALLHLNSTYSQNYDWFLKADDDTFVVMENLRHFVIPLNESKAVWFGYKLKHPQLPMGYMSGGAGYMFSKAALQDVAEVLKREFNLSNSNCRSGYPVGLEDLELGKCFAAAGVTDVDTVDSKGRETFLPLPIETLWKKNVPSYHWIWRQAWNPLKLGHECCSSQIISTHQNTPEQMEKLFEALYVKKDKSKITKDNLKSL